MGEVKKTTIIHAEGEKMSAEMIGKAIKENPGFVELRRIEVAKQVATMLAKSSNRMVLSSDALLLNLMDGNTVSEGPTTTNHPQRRSSWRNSTTGVFLQQYL